MSRFELNDKDFEKEIDTFLENTGNEYWKELLRKFENSPDGLYKSEYLAKRNPLLEPLKEYFLLRDSGKSILRNRSKKIDMLASTASTTNYILKKVNQKGKDQIIGRLTSDGIASILFEFNTVVHLISMNYSVDFVEYNNPLTEKRTFEFLATKGSLECEIECKRKSSDAGRKITRPSFYQLCDAVFLSPELSTTKCIIEINFRKRIVNKFEVINNIVSQIVAAIINNSTNTLIDNNVNITIHYLPSSQKKLNAQSFSSIIEPYHTPKSHFAIKSSDIQTLIIKAESENVDEVLKAIYIELKNSLDQFSKTRPALLACYLEGVYPEQWENLIGETGISYMTTKLLNRKNAGHIHTVAYSSEHIVSNKGKIVDITYPSLFYRNRDCRYYKEKNIFFS